MTVYANQLDALHPHVSYYGDSRMSLGAGMLSFKCLIISTNLFLLTPYYEQKAVLQTPFTVVQINMKYSQEQELFTPPVNVVLHLFTFFIIMSPPRNISCFSLMIFSCLEILFVF